MKLTNLTIIIIAAIMIISCNSTKKSEGKQTVEVEKENIKEGIINNSLSVDVFKGETEHVNTYLFNNGKTMIAMDVQGSSEEAKKLAEVIKSKGLPLTHIIVSHGHPDHYTGMYVLNQEFPDAKIIVATQNIKDDIIGFSTWMESVGWLDKEPHLKPKSEKNSNGFDYEKLINVLNTSALTLDGGGTLEINTDFLPAEAPHLTTLYSKDLNALFTADWCYNNFHLWFGQGVDNNHIANWKAQLEKFKEKYHDSNIIIYPGHGDKTDVKIFNTLIEYIDNFNKIIKESNTEEEAMKKMESLYPTYKEADFLLLNSVKYHMGLKNKNS